MAESEEELKNLLMKVKGESEKAGLKLNIQKMKIMASGPITSWQIEGKKVEAVTDFKQYNPMANELWNCSFLFQLHLHENSNGNNKKTVYVIGTSTFMKAL